MFNYCATKAAVEWLLKTVAVEYPHVRALNFSPGLVQTPAMDNAEKEGPKENIAMLAMFKQIDGAYHKDPVDVMRKMVKFIQEDTFTSGMFLY